MGADGWQVKLFHRNRDVTKEHGDFFRVAEGKGFRWEPYFQLWSWDSKSLAAITWDEKPVHLYEVAAKRDKHLSYTRLGLRSPQWAPDMDRLLLSYLTEGVLVDRSGAQHGLVQWRIAAHDTPHTGWLQSGRCFFLLARQAARPKTAISFFSGVDGALQETHDLDPSDIVPYNANDYLQLSRDGLSLVSADAGFRSVGSLLDTWSDVSFDQTSGTLFLGVFRPVSLPYRAADGELVCKVKQSWVAVEIGAN